ncbi:MAG: methionyl-tRNA formyltransferase [Eggerthellaceae bacterium]|nr:methionyl-tRNA formyltransferase [Eggerthellaceae bacterium]
MRIVFMGTPDLAATILKRLADAHEVVGVVTRPDAVRGRGNKAIPSPVKEVALSLGIPVYERTSFRDRESVEQLELLNPDVVCVAACGIILPKDVLDIPRFGCLNVHTSLLPRWRGAAPIERSILEEDAMTGVCIMRMEEGLDTGDYCRRVEVPIEQKNVAELSDELARVGADQLVEAIAEVVNGTAVWTSQGSDGITYAEKIKKGELSLDPSDTARRAVAKVRASNAAHPARIEIADRTLAVERASVVEDEQGASLCADLEAGQARFAAKRLFLKANDGAFELLNVRPDGKKSMDARSFAGGIQGIKNMQLTWGRA